jgi:hypothetical protein
MRNVVTQALAGVAALFAIGAFVIALTNAGPPGPKGLQGRSGSSANTVALSKAVAADNATVTAVKNCLPELTAWINGFNVSSYTDSQTGDLMSAYLDTSGRQVASDCRTMLFGKVSSSSLNG